MVDELRLKFITIGDSGVGKTSILRQYINEEYHQDLASTVAVDIFMKDVQYRSNETQKIYTVHLQLWDTAGQERFRSLTNAFFRDAIGFILVFDLTDETSFLNIRHWIGDIQSNITSKEISFILIGNKCDLADRRIISEARAKQFAKQNQLQYIETSAAKNINITESINLLLGLVIKQYEEQKFSDHANDQNINLRNKGNKSISNCCF